MRSEALRARPRRRRIATDDGQRSVAAIAPNVLDRVTAERPNQKWIADFTYIWTAEGWLYVAAVIDLFSRRVVGWSMKAEMTAQLVTDALIMAVWRRGKPDALLHHSDQGSQYRVSSSALMRIRRRMLRRKVCATIITYPHPLFRAANKIWGLSVGFQPGQSKRPSLMHCEQEAGS